jgi:hypothetical protein
MKVHIVCFSTLFSAPLLFAYLFLGSVCGAATTVIGPGPHPLLYVTNADNYRILDGTQIISPSQSGFPGSLVVVTDAIEFRGGGDIQIDGGYFRGGDATYTNYGSLGGAFAGDALHLRYSTGTVYGGTFIGGAATSWGALNSAFGGAAVILVESTLTIYGGYFEAGVGRRETYVFQSAGASLFDNSSLFLHGGEFNGSLEIHSGSTLTIFARDYQVNGMYVSGEYADGSRFNHHILNDGGTLIMKGIPEPTTACLAAIAGCVTFSCKLRQPARARR